MERSRRLVAAATAAVAVIAVAGVVWLALPAPEALAHVVVVAAHRPKQPPRLGAVIQRITWWLIGIAAGVATLGFAIGGIRYMVAFGDAAEIKAAKDTMLNAAKGYLIVILASVLVSVLKGFVGQ